MTEIRVVPADLVNTATQIEDALGVADEVQNSNGTLAAMAAGAGDGPSFGAIESFLNKWSYGLSCMTDDARNLAALLRSAGQAYEQTEQAITEAAK